MTHGRGSEGETDGMGSQYSHTTLEYGVSSITNADAHTSAASNRLNWRPRRFKWTRPFWQKTKSGFCACAITFQTQSTTAEYMEWIFFISCIWKKEVPKLYMHVMILYILTPCCFIVDAGGHCQFKYLHQIPTMADQTHDVRNYFSLWFFDFILLTLNFDSCVSCLQEMFPCCLLLPRWPSKSTSTNSGRLGCQIRKWWCKNSHSCSFVPKTREWTSCGWRHWFQQGVWSNSSSFHARRVYIRTLSASWQQTEESIP